MDRGLECANGVNAEGSCGPSARQRADKQADHQKQYGEIMVINMDAGRFHD
jgi:hypothetical protein